MADQVDATINVWVDGELYAETLSRVLELEIDERTDCPSALTMSLDMVPTGATSDAPAAHDWDLLASGPFALLKQLTVELGLGPLRQAPTSRTILFAGYITALEPHFGEARVPDSRLVVHALDAGCLMQVEERTVPWADLPDSEIVKQIYQRYGFSVDVEATPTLRSKDRGPLIQRTTDAELVRWLARRNGFEAYVERSDAPVKTGAAVGPEHVGHFHGPRVQAAKQPPLELAPATTPSVQRLRARWDGLRPTTILASHIDERTRRQRNVTLAASRLAKMASTDRTTILKERLGRALPNLTGMQAVMRQLEGVPYDVEEVSSLAWSAYQEADFWVEAHADVEGLRYPQVLRARRPVTLTGAGKLLDGDWYVRGARHHWQRAKAEKRYDVAATLVRNALGGMG